MTQLATKNSYSAILFVACFKEPKLFLLFFDECRGFVKSKFWEFWQVWFPCLLCIFWILIWNFWAGHMHWGCVALTQLWGVCLSGQLWASFWRLIFAFFTVFYYSVTFQILAYYLSLILYRPPCFICFTWVLISFEIWLGCCQFDFYSNGTSRLWNCKCLFFARLKFGSSLWTGSRAWFCSPLDEYSPSSLADLDKCYEPSSWSSLCLKSRQKGNFQNTDYTVQISLNL